MKSMGLGEPVVHQVAAGVYAVTDLFYPTPNFGTNVGVILNSQAAVFIDCGMTIASAEFVWAFAWERMHGVEQAYLILTHDHADHVFGMRVFKEHGARVVAHAAVRDTLGKDGEHYKQRVVERGCQRGEWDHDGAQAILGNVVLSLPDEMIASDTVLRFGGDAVHILVTPGHVPGELSVYHPASRTLFAGDTVYGGIPPSTKFGGPAKWRIWVKQLERLRQLEIDTICPGHGRLCTKVEIDRQAAYLQALLSE